MGEDVVLSGGDKGGETVDATGWSIGTARDIDGYLYCRVTTELALFVGLTDKPL